jgi:hypothetical protein
METKSNEYKNIEYAKKLLSSANFVAATPLVIAADIVTKGGALTWEYETLFDELEDEKCLPSEKLRDKLMASISALHNPAFLWDAGIFKSMCQSLNGNIAATHIWEELTPAKVAYAMEEIDALHDVYQGARDLNPLYGDSPIIYMGGCCAINGFIRPPKKMDICEKIYHRFFNLKEPDLRTQVTSELEKRKHMEVDAYVNSLGNIRKDQLSSLKNY